MLNSIQFAQGLHKQLRQGGGFTADPRTGQQPSEGIAVSLAQHQATFPNAQPSDIKGYIDEKAAPLSEPGAHIGGWDDRKQTGKDYLDVTHVYPGETETPLGKAHAISLAARHNQIAAMDLASFNEVRNPYYGTTYPEGFHAAVKADYDKAAAPYRG